MIPTDADIAALCAAIYQHPSWASWDVFDAGEDDGICWALKHLDGYDVIVFRGSVIFQDWIRDLRAAPIRTRVGHVHDGFYAGLEHAWSDIHGLLKQPVIVAGHSLGAGRVAILTGMMIKDGVVPVARVVFGEPKPGLPDLAALIGAVPGRSYRNGDGEHHDLVTDVPFTFPPIQYVHPTPIIPVCAPPAANDRWGAFAYHHMELYQVAVTAARVAVSV